MACFSDEGSLHHLVTEPEQAVFFRRDSREDLERAIREAIGILGRRAGRDSGRLRRRRLVLTKPASRTRGAILKLEWSYDRP